ncbi:unnamed protein product [Boreogadus saida]
MLYVDWGVGGLGGWDGEGGGGGGGPSSIYSPVSGVAVGERSSACVSALFFMNVSSPRRHSQRPRCPSPETRRRAEQEHRFYVEVPFINVVWISVVGSKKTKKKTWKKPNIC